MLLQFFLRFYAFRFSPLHFEIVTSVAACQAKQLARAPLPACEKQDLQTMQQTMRSNLQYSRTEKTQSRCPSAKRFWRETAS